MAKTHRENVWIFCKMDCGIFVKARPGEICPGGEKGEYLAATNDELFVKISTTKPHARAAADFSSLNMREKSNGKGNIYEHSNDHL